MKKLKLDFDSIEGIIDQTIQDKENVTFICEGDIAQYIKDYILDDYDINSYEFNGDIDPDEIYVVTAQYPNEDDNIEFEIIIETLEDEDGDYKEIENSGMCYDLSDIDKNIIFEIVDTDELEYCEFVYDDSEEECDCEDCQREKAYMDYVGEQVIQAWNLVSDEEACDKCKFIALLGLFELGACGVANGIVNPNNFIDEEK